MRLSGRSLALLWLLGAIGFTVELTATMRRARNGFSHARASVRAAHEREAQGRLDSAMAYARAPLAVTASGDTVRALAYASIPHIATSRNVPFWPQFMAVVWAFKIPIVLLALTLAYLSNRIRRSSSVPAPAP